MTKTTPYSVLDEAASNAQRQGKILLWYDLQRLKAMNLASLTVHLSIDGDHACALIGINLQEGESEFEKINATDKTLKSAEWHAAMRAKKKLEDRLGLGQCGYYLGEGL